MEEDPILYLRLSELIQTAIDAHRAKRLSDIDYLQQMKSHMETVRNGGTNTVPMSLQNRPQARAFYNVLQDKLSILPPILPSIEIEASDAKSTYAGDLDELISKIVNIAKTYEVN